MTTNQYRLMDLQETIRHNKAEEKIDKYQAKTQRGRVIADTVLRSVDTVVNSIATFLPKVKVSKSIASGQTALSDKAIDAKLTNLRKLIASDYANASQAEVNRVVNNYIEQQIINKGVVNSNNKGGKK